MIKQNVTYICDECNAILKPNKMIWTESVQHEGSSTINYCKKSIEIGEQQFCDIRCLTKYIGKKLGIIKEV